MHSFPTYLAILALPVSEAFVVTYYEGSFQSVTGSAQFLTTGNRTKTVVVTVTQTNYMTEEIPFTNTAPHEDSNHSSGLAVPPLPDSVPHPSKKSDYGGSTLTETLATSSQPTGLTSISKSSMPTSKESQPGLFGFIWPTRKATSSSDAVIATSARTSESAMVSRPAPERSSPSKTEAELSVSPTNSVHPRCKARPTHAPNAEAPIKRNVNSSLTDFSFLHPTNFGWTTMYVDTAVDSEKEDDAPSTSIQKRVEESKAKRRRMGYWSRFFAIAQPVAGNKCLACDYEGQITCLPNEKYMWCKGGCMVVERLGCDMVCEGDGQI